MNCSNIAGSYSAQHQPTASPCNWAALLACPQLTCPKRPSGVIAMMLCSLTAQASQGLGSLAAFGELDTVSADLNRIYQSMTAVLASPLLLQYDTSWQERASAWVLLGLSIMASAAFPAAIQAITLAAGTLRTAGKLMLASEMPCRHHNCSDPLATAVLLSDGIMWPHVCQFALSECSSFRQSRPFCWLRLSSCTALGQVAVHVTSAVCSFAGVQQLQCALLLMLSLHATAAACSSSSALLVCHSCSMLFFACHPCMPQLQRALFQLLHLNAIAAACSPQYADRWL